MVRFPDPVFSPCAKRGSWPLDGASRPGWDCFSQVASLGVAGSRSRFLVTSGPLHCEREAGTPQLESWLGGWGCLGRKGAHPRVVLVGHLTWKFQGPHTGLLRKGPGPPLPLPQLYTAGLFSPCLVLLPTPRRATPPQTWAMKTWRVSLPPAGLCRNDKRGKFPECGSQVPLRADTPSITHTPNTSPRTGAVVCP